MKNSKTRNLLTYIGILFILSLSLFIFIQIYSTEEQDGILKVVEEINNGAIGAILTAFVTVLLLQGQTDSEVKREQDITIFQNKVATYANFTNKMWSMLNDEKITVDEINELRSILFGELVFYLNEEQIKQITEIIQRADFFDPNNAAGTAGEISQILQEDLNNRLGIPSTELRKLFNSFNKHTKEVKSFELNENKDSFNDIEHKKEFISLENDELLEDEISSESSTLKTERNIKYWHFNMLDVNKQLQAFENGNWVLSLTEYGEDWRTNAVKQVKEGDIIFLLKRAGNGYIGAFKALDIKILEAGKTYSSEELAKFDIYGGLADGADLVSNIIVQPIAFNYKGVGYKSVRRRTIERIRDLGAIEFLLNRFAGNDLSENNLLGKDKLKNDILLTNLDSDTFHHIFENSQSYKSKLGYSLKILVNKFEEYHTETWNDFVFNTSKFGCYSYPFRIKLENNIIADLWTVLTEEGLYFGVECRKNGNGKFNYHLTKELFPEFEHNDNDEECYIGKKLDKNLSQEEITLFLESKLSEFIQKYK